MSITFGGSFPVTMLFSKLYKFEQLKIARSSDFRCNPALMTKRAGTNTYTDRLSYSRAARVSAVSVLVTWFLTGIAFALPPYDADVFSQMFVPTLVISTIVPIIVSFPVAIILQKERIKLARALQELERVHADLEQAHEELGRRARIDALTGLLNREAMLEEIGILRDAGEDGAMLMIDVDHFKLINDTYGHQSGDDALQEIARTLTASVPPGALVGRLGGEEFALFLPCDRSEAALDAAEKVRLAIRDIDFAPDGVRHSITVSVGMAMSTPDDALSAVMKRADLNLYKAKRAGRDRVILNRAA